MKKLHLLSILFSVISIPTFADNSNSTSEQTKIFVTGGRIEVDAEKDTTTYTLTQVDIEKSSAQDLPHLLQLVPGVTMDRNGGRGALSNIRVRGAESDHVLILIDGVRNYSATAGTTAIQHIPLAQIERIEVIKGPQSGVYGSDAMAGVIQIFTKKGKNNFGGYIEAGAGTYGTNTLSAGFNDGKGNHYYGVNVSNYETDGIDARLNTSNVDADNDAYDEQSISLNFGREVNQGTNYDLSLLSSKGNLKFDNFSLSSFSDENTDYKNNTVSFSLDQYISRALTLNSTVGYAKDHRETFGSNTSVFTTERDSFNVYLEHSVSEQSSMVVGYDYYKDDVESTTAFAETERKNDAYFAEYLYKVSLLTTQLSVRSDQSKIYGTNTTGKLFLGYSLNDRQSLSLSYGTAFKAPTFNDLYFPNFSNPNLNPEISNNVQLGFSQKLSGYKFDASIYQTNIKDLIVFSSGAPNNVNEARLLGGELSLSYAGDTASWGTSLSHTDAENKVTNQRLNRRPRTTFNIFADKRVNDWLFSANLLAEDGRRQSATSTTDGYGLVDLGVQYDVTGNDVVNLKLGNIFNKKYTLINTYNTEGATVNLSYKHLF